MYSDKNVVWKCDLNHEKISNVRSYNNDRSTFYLPRQDYRNALKSRLKWAKRGIVFRF